MSSQAHIIDRTSHIDIVKNPDIQAFLSECTYMVEPSDEEVYQIASLFSEIIPNDSKLPNNIISIDGSNYEASIDKKLPFTRLGYVKIGNILIKRNSFESLATEKFINPFSVAKITRDNSATTFAFPSSNMIYRGQTSVRDSFRLALDSYLYKYRNNPNNPKTSLRTTLFKLASYRAGVKQNHLYNELTLHRCPNPDCDGTDLIVWDVEELQKCPLCGKPIYPSDCLRIWEEIEDTGSNQTALTRFTNVIEHLFAIHYIRTIVESSPESFVETLSDLCIFLDGSLAIYGNAAWLHASIMKYLAEINMTMNEKGKPNILILGLIRNGAVCDYFKLLQYKLPSNSIYCLSDEIRDKYVNFNRVSSGTTFGNETYYGQDFVYKTSSGNLFVFNIPYPFPAKSNSANFKLEKSNIKNYKNLDMYIKLLNDFECDLYENAIVPIALARRHTSISLSPGSQVLDLLTKNTL